MTNKKNLGILGLIVLAVIAGILIYRDRRTSVVDITGTSPDGSKNFGIDMTGDGKVQIQPLNSPKLPPVPSLTRSTDSGIVIAPEVKKILLASNEKIVTALKKDPSNVNNWIDLGLVRKSLGDYIGARDAWEYAKALNPDGNIVPWNNLGDLYHFYLKDYPKSEENWKKVITLKPDYIQAYRGLFELYTYSYKEKANQIPVFLKVGIAKNPSSTDLKQMLADYQKTL